MYYGSGTLIAEILFLFYNQNLVIYGLQERVRRRIIDTACSYLEQMFPLILTEAAAE